LSQACDGHAIGGDSSFFVAGEETLAEVIAEYAATCEKSREIAADHSLDDTAEHHLVGRVNLRFIYLGMIGDIARHAGHADILVEQIRAKTANRTALASPPSPAEPPRSAGRRRGPRRRW